MGALIPFSVVGLLDSMLKLCFVFLVLKTVIGLSPYWGFINQVGFWIFESERIFGCEMVY